MQITLFFLFMNEEIEAQTYDTESVGEYKR